MGATCMFAATYLSAGTVAVSAEAKKFLAFALRELVYGRTTLFV